MDVVEHEQHWLVSPQSLQQAPHGPVRLSERCRLRAICKRGQPVEHECSVLLAGERPLGLRPAKRPEQREKRDASPVRDAAGDEHCRLVSFAQRHLARETRLADARVADDGDDAAAAGVARGDERSVQVVELLGAAGERRVEAPLRANECGGALVEPDPAAAGELDRAREDGSGPWTTSPVATPAGKPSSRAASTARSASSSAGPSAPKTATSLSGPKRWSEPP